MARGSYTIIPALAKPPSHAEVRKAEILGQPHPQEAQLANYVLTLIGYLRLKAKETGELDVAMADRIERLLWPDRP